MTRQTPRTLIGMLVTCIALAAHAAVNTPTCQIIDNTPTPAWDLSLSIIPAADYEVFGKSGQVELDAYWEMAYFHEVWLADIDLSLSSEMTFFTDSAGLGLPNAVWALYADNGWTWRYVGGSALHLRLAPGFYADMQELNGSGFRMPVMLAGVRRFSGTTSGILGADIRVGFEDWFIPVAGIAWQPSPTFRGEFMIPTTRVLWFPNNIWAFHSGIEWNNTSYRIKPDDGIGYKQLTVEDFRLTFGSSYIVSDQLFVRFEAGSVFGRTTELGESTDGVRQEIQPDSTVFFRFSLNGPF